MLLDVSEFGDWLHKSRVDKGLSLRQLEQRINKVCTFGFLDQLEKDLRGKRGRAIRPNEAIVEALAKEFHVSAEYLRGLAGIGSGARKPQNVAEFFEALESIGIELEPALAERVRLEDFTPDQFQELLERVKFDTEMNIRRFLR